MKDFIYGLYQNDNFTLILVIALVVLIIAFVLVYFFGKKDQKLEETKRLQKIELDAFKKVEEKPEKVEVTKEEVKENVPEVSNEVTVTEFVPEEKEESEEIELPQVKEEVKPIFKDTDEEKNPISIDELPKEEVKPIFDNNEEDKKLENDLNSLESIKNEFNSIDIPEVKEEKPIFKPSPQIFSSVFVDKKEENIVSNNEEKLFDTRKISKDPNIDEVIHSNMVDFNNFKVKEENNNFKEEQNNEDNKQEIKQPEEKNKTTNNSDYDDFFDDFFFEE